MTDSPSRGATIDGEVMALVLARLERALGPAASRRCADRTLEKIGRKHLSSADDMLKFANSLLEEGGVNEAIGRALKVTALLRGARDR